MRHNFNSKASERLSNALYDVRKLRRLGKPHPNWIHLDVYRDLEKIWDEPKYKERCETNKRARNTSTGDDGPHHYTHEGPYPCLSIAGVG